VPLFSQMPVFSPVQMSSVIKSDVEFALNEQL